MIRTGLIANLVVVAAFLIALPSSFAQKNSVISSQRSLKPMEIVDVFVKKRSDGVSILTLEFNGDLTTIYSDSVSSFMMKNPDRLIFDLPVVFTKLESSGLINNDVGGLIKGYSFISLNNKTRLVVDVRNINSFRKQVDGNVLTFLLSNSDNKNVLESNTDSTSAGTEIEGASNVITNKIRFRRSEQSGLIIVNLPEAYGGVDFSQTSQGLTLSINGVRLDPQFQKKLDVSDFSTPVQEIMAYQVSKEVVRIDIKNKGIWSYTSWQKGNELVIQVSSDKKGMKEGEVVSKLDTYYGDKLSVNFQQIEVRALLQVIADFTALNIVVGDSVSGNVTIRLKDVPWDQLLDIVLQSRGLAMRKAGNVLMIGGRDELLSKEKFAFDTYNLTSDLEPLVQEGFVINYHKAVEVAKLLDENGSRRILSKRGAVVVDSTTNQLFVYDTALKIEEARKIVTKVDIPVRQIEIEARIVEANDDFNRELGVKLGYNDRRGSIYSERTSADGTKYKVPVFAAGNDIGGGNRFSLSGDSTGVQDISSQNGSADGNDYRLGKSNVDAGNFVNLPGASIDGSNPASLALSFFRSGMTEFINLELSALESQSLGRVVSSPRVVTTDRKKAVIESGSEISYSIFNANGDASTAFKKVVLKLEVTPHITPDGNVMLEIILNKDNVNKVTAAGVTIDTKLVNTTVLIENGGTVVVGGIYAQDEKDIVTKVPFLGDIPVLGMLFRKKTKIDRKSETLLFITPRVIQNTVFSNR